ncbi:sensor histidine kinase [Aquipuribacter sp. MA13-6]|uniref:sensor histidine kinase n=1 Tax=unclassified Aquipuribacter TaxID=2635084 RepID=UPI003EE843AC
MTPSPAPGAAVAERDAWDRAVPHAWDRAVVGWHTAFWVVLGLTVLSLLLDGGTRGGRAVAGAGALGALALAYAVLGGPAARDRSQWRALGYLGVLVVALPVLLWVSGGGTSFLLFLAYPQVWMLVEGRLRASVATAVVSLAALTGFVLAAGGDVGSLRTAGVAIVVSFLFSLTLGLWFSSVVEQSADRADLIAQLESTRTDLAAAERAAGAAQVQASMARDIHDTLAQGFTSLVMLSQVARRELVSSPPEVVAGRLETMEEVARTNLAEARALVAAFSPVDVHGSDLAGALGRLADRFATETGTTVEVDVDDSLEDVLTPETAVVLLRSAQEGLANVRKHAAARTVGLRLHRDPAGPLRLEVTDDGVGYDPDRQGAGFGLDGLRARAGDVGGTVGLDPVTGGGTRLAVEVPSR